MEQRLHRWRPLVVISIVQEHDQLRHPFHAFVQMVFKQYLNYLVDFCLIPCQ